MEDEMSVNQRDSVVLHREITRQSVDPDVVQRIQQVVKRVRTGPQTAVTTLSADAPPKNPA
jgi:hypothetical protein